MVAHPSLQSQQRNINVIGNELGGSADASPIGASNPSTGTTHPSQRRFDMASDRMATREVGSIISRSIHQCGR